MKNTCLLLLRDQTRTYFYFNKYRKKNHIILRITIVSNIYETIFWDGENTKGFLWKKNEEFIE